MYASARLEEDIRREVYEVYVTDALRHITENTARFGGGQFMKSRYYDSIHPQPVSDKSGEEIAADIIRRAGLKMKGSDAA